MSAPSSAHVDYAPPPRWHRRRRWRRLLLPLTLVALGGSSVWWWPPVWRHLDLLNRQRQCISYRHPPGHVVFDQSPARSIQLQNADSRYVTVNPPSSSVGYTVPSWNAFYSMVSPPGAQPAGVVFLHWRKNGMGKSRLVVVGARWRYASPEAFLVLDAKVCQPGSLLTRPKLLSDEELVVPGVVEVAGPVRFYAGQPDPSDESHFTFEFETASFRGTFDAWLGDSDRVLVQLRQPLQFTRRPPASPASLPSAGPAAAGPASRASR
jgi:hypothetical protein